MPWALLMQQQNSIFKVTVRYVHAFSLLQHRPQTKQLKSVSSFLHGRPMFIEICRVNSMIFKQADLPLISTTITHMKPYYSHHLINEDDTWRTLVPGEVDRVNNHYRKDLNWYWGLWPQDFVFSLSLYIWWVNSLIFMFNMKMQWKIVHHYVYYRLSKFA